jgi:6-phosphofructokinase
MPAGGRAMNTGRGTIGILTGGGDVPGLNPAIRAVTNRALREGYRVIGIRRGWAGLVDLVRDPEADNADCVTTLSEEIVNKAGRTGGTFLHTSRTLPSRVPRSEVPRHLAGRFAEDVNDLTPEVLENLAWLGIDSLIPIGGDDTLGYGVRLAGEGVKVVALPGSHERFLVLEVFGRYAGFTALLPTFAGAAHRCVIPEHKFDVEDLTRVLSDDRRRNPSRYSVVLVSEGAMFEGGEMVFQDEVRDAYGHAKLGGIGDLVAARLKQLSPRFNDGATVDVINQKLGYLVRCGDPDAIDSIVPMAYGNLALDLILAGRHRRLVGLRNGRYGDVPIDVVTASRKTLDVDRYYDRRRLRPRYERLEANPLFIMTSD